ncbi:MAG: hypothetical protein AAGB29_03110 [Planctomycetota bacterium]
MTPTLDQPSSTLGLGPSSRAPSLSGNLVDDDGSQPLLDPGVPWLVVAVIAAVLLRLGLLWLGPMTDPTRSLDAVPTEQQAMVTTAVEERWFAMPSQIEEPAAVAEALEAVGLTGDASEAPMPGFRHERYHLPGPTAVGAAIALVSDDARVGPIAQAALSVLTVLLAFAAVSLVWGRAAGAVAAWVMALAPALVIDPLGMQPVVVPTLLILAAVALLADRRAGPLHGLLGGGCVGAAGLFAAPLLLAGPALAGWVALRQRNVSGLVAGVIALVTTAAPIGAWTARNIAMGTGPLPTVAPIVGLLEADAAVADAVAAQNPIDPLEERPFGPTAAAVNLSQPAADAEASDRAAWRDWPLTAAATRLLGEPGLTASYLLERVTAPFLNDRSAELHGLLGLTPPEGSAIERWLSGDYLLSQSPSPLADAMALTTLAAWGVMIAVVPFGLAIAAWRRRWSGLVLIGGLGLVVVPAALLSPSPDGLLPLTLPLLAIAASGLAARAKPRQARLVKPKRRAKAKADTSAASEADEPILARTTVEPEMAPDDPADSPIATALVEPLASTSREKVDKPVEPETQTSPESAEDEQSRGLRLPKLPSIDRMAATYDVAEEDAPEEVLPRRSGRPI